MQTVLETHVKQKQPDMSEQMRNTYTAAGKYKYKQEERPEHFYKARNMTILEYMERRSLEARSMGIKIENLKDYIGRPVWSSREDQWRIIQSVVYFQDNVKVYFTDGVCQCSPRKMQETWLQLEKGGDIVGV